MMMRATEMPFYPADLSSNSRHFIPSFEICATRVKEMVFFNSRPVAVISLSQFD